MRNTSICQCNVLQFAVVFNFLPVYLIEYNIIEPQKCPLACLGLSKMQDGLMGHRSGTPNLCMKHYVTQHDTRRFVCKGKHFSVTL